MKVETIPCPYPDVVITLSWGDSQQLYHMLLEAKAYASSCNESTELHEEFVRRLGEVVLDV